MEGGKGREGRRGQNQESEADDKNMLPTHARHSHNVTLPRVDSVYTPRYPHRPDHPGGDALPDDHKSWAWRRQRE